MTLQPIRFRDKFSLFNEHWSPKVIAQMNDYQFKLVKVLGDFVWHSHSHTDEVFIVLSGQLRIDFRDDCVVLSEGDMFVVPKGIEHKPYANEETELLIVEPIGVINTGDQSAGDMTAKNDVWI